MRPQGDSSNVQFSSTDPQLERSTLDYDTDDLINNYYHQQTIKIKNEAPWGNACIDIDEDDQDVLRIYCQNVNGIFDTNDIGLDEAFHTMHILHANIFTFNETHGNDLNLKTKKILRKSQQKIWQQQ